MLVRASRDTLSSINPVSVSLSASPALWLPLCIWCITWSPERLFFKSAHLTRLVVWNSECCLIDFKSSNPLSPVCLYVHLQQTHFRLGPHTARFDPTRARPFKSYRLSWFILYETSDQLRRNVISVIFFNQSEIFKQTLWLQWHHFCIMAISFLSKNLKMAFHVVYCLRIGIVAFKCLSLYLCLLSYLDKHPKKTPLVHILVGVATGFKQ